MPPKHLPTPARGCWRKGGPSQPCQGWGPTLTSSSFSRMSFSVSASGTGGMTGMGKSVPLSRVSLLQAERGGEDASSPWPPMGAAAPETPNIAGTPHPPTQTLSPPGPALFPAGRNVGSFGHPPKPQHPRPREVPGTPTPGHRALPGCFELGSGSPHPIFSLLLQKPSKTQHLPSPPQDGLPKPPAARPAPGMLALLEGAAGSPRAHPAAWDRSQPSRWLVPCQRPWRGPRAPRCVPATWLGRGRWGSRSPSACEG